jgi:DNA-binding response OmpR family regulator
VTDTSGKRIFIVEDDVDMVEMLSTYFRSQGYRIATAGWGEEAVKQIEANPPDVVLLDIRLPDIDGYEVCARLRESRRTRHVPVIFLTERREREDKLAGLELGAIDYITKPFDIQELRLRIRNALRRIDMQPLRNPITNLPEGYLVTEQLETVLAQAEWALVVASVRDLESFRDEYGFVAADDVTRAVGLMLQNAVQEAGKGAEIIGHADAADFIMVTEPGNCRRLVRQCLMRLEPSIPYFYPADDRDRVDAQPASERLFVQVVCLTSADGPVRNVSELRAALQQRLS